MWLLTMPGPREPDSTVVYQVVLAPAGGGAGWGCTAKMPGPSGSTSGVVLLGISADGAV